MNSAGKPHRNANISVSSVLRRSPVFRISKLFLSKFITASREGGLDGALIDVTMPDGNGLDLVPEIYDGGPGAPIPTLVLTANLDHSVAARAIEAAAQGALSKMVSVPETLEAIKRLTVPGRSES
jgi:DNA-binding NarL/FixJ family response regulator